MQLSLRQINYVLAAAETGQFSAAAIKMHVTQTAITGAIKDLEGVLGVALFTRHHASGVSLTVDGQKFLHHAYGISAAVNSALHDPGLMRQNVTGKVRFGATPAVLSVYLVPAIARFSKAYPQIELDVQELERPDLETAIQEGRIDLGGAWLANLSDPDQLEMVALTRARRQLWLPASHALLTKRSIALTDVAPLPYALYTQDETPRNTMRFWQSCGLQPNIKYRVSSVETLRSLVAQGLAVSIISDAAYRPFSMEGLRVETRPLDDGLPSIEIGLAWSPRRPMTPATEIFKTFMQLTFGGVRSGVRVI
ncbi:MAG: LysR family transcriptional regulator [Acidovorax sp.]